MACTGCRKARRDLAAAVRQGDAKALAVAAGAGARLLARKIKPPPLLRRVVKRIPR